MLSEKYKVELAKLDELGIQLDPVSFLNETYGSSFVLPLGKQYARFDELEELFPNDILYHGTTAEKFGQIKKSGVIDVELASGRIFLTKHGEIALAYTKGEQLGAIVPVRVKDVPGGVVPPYSRVENGKAMYYGNMSGVGVARQSVPFEKNMEAIAEMDEKERALWRICDVKLNGRLTGISAAIHFRRSGPAALLDASSKGIKTVEEAYSDLVRRYDEIDTTQLDDRFPITVIEAVRSELEKLRSILYDSDRLERQIDVIAKIGRSFRTRRYELYLSTVNERDRRF